MTSCITMTILSLCMGFVCELTFAQESFSEVPNRFAGKNYSARFDLSENRNNFYDISFDELELGCFQGLYIDFRKTETNTFRCLENKECYIDNIVEDIEKNIISFITNRPVKDENNSCFANVERSYKFAPNGFDVETKIVAEREFEFAATYRVFDLYLIPVESLKGATVEAKISNKPGQIFLAMIPEKYSKDLWSSRGRFSEIKLIINNSTVVFTAHPDTTLSLNHYGGHNIEVIVRPLINRYRLSRKPGQSDMCGHSVVFL